MGSGSAGRRMVRGRKCRSEMYGTSELAEVSGWTESAAGDWVVSPEFTVPSVNTVNAVNAQNTVNAVDAETSQSTVPSVDAVDAQNTVNAENTVQSERDLLYSGAESEDDYREFFETFVEAHHRRTAEDYENYLETVEGRWEMLVSSVNIAADPVVDEVLSHFTPSDDSEMCLLEAVYDAFSALDASQKSAVLDVFWYAIGKGEESGDVMGELDDVMGDVFTGQYSTQSSAQISGQSAELLSTESAGLYSAGSSLAFQ